ncbi:MAG TPA: hypothetical protein VM432_13790 [Bdellovibrionales bacterium]|nr:hypothetical protein [Bdellovibrionales bacterium]
MKTRFTLLFIAALAFSTSASAGTEVNYNFNPFLKQAWTWSSQDPSELAVFAAQLKKVTTKGISTEYACGVDRDLVCFKVKPVEQVEAVEVILNYFTSTSSDPWIEDTLYVDPSTLSPEAARMLSSGKRLTGKKVREILVPQAHPIEKRVYFTVTPRN